MYLKFDKYIPFDAHGGEREYRTHECGVEKVVGYVAGNLAKYPITNTQLPNLEKKEMYCSILVHREFNDLFCLENCTYCTNAVNIIGGRLIVFNNIWSF